MPDDAEGWVLFADMPGAEVVAGELAGRAREAVAAMRGLTTKEAEGFVQRYCWRHFRRPRHSIRICCQCTGLARRF